MKYHDRKVENRIERPHYHIIYEKGSKPKWSPFCVVCVCVYGSSKKKSYYAYNLKFNPGWINGKKFKAVDTPLILSIITIKILLIYGIDQVAAAHLYSPQVSFS